MKASPVPGSGFHWVHPDIQCERSPIHGLGLFAQVPIPEGTIVVAYGGYVFPVTDELGSVDAGDYAIQITDALELGPRKLSELGTGDFVNHSCDGTCGFRGSSILVSRRLLVPGDEITFDYALTLYEIPGFPEFRFMCSCGSSLCRGEVSWHDWKLPELQSRYQGLFQPFLQEKMHPSGPAAHFGSESAQDSGGGRDGRSRTDLPS